MAHAGNCASLHRGRTPDISVALRRIRHVVSDGRVLQVTTIALCPIGSGGLEGRPHGLANEIQRPAKAKPWQLARADLWLANGAQYLNRIHGLTWEDGEYLPLWSRDAATVVHQISFNRRDSRVRRRSITALREQRSGASTLDPQCRRCNL